MKKIILGVVLLCAFGCYKDNGEPLRTIFEQKETEEIGNTITTPPCESDWVTNSFSTYEGRSYFTSLTGSYTANYIPGGYAIFANGSGDYYFRIEFKNKPIEKKNYTTTNINNSRNDQCIIYATHKITNEILFAENLQPVYVDILTNGKLKVSFCDMYLRHNIGSNHMTIYDFSINSSNL